MLHHSKSDSVCGVIVKSHGNQISRIVYFRDINGVSLKHNSNLTKTIFGHSDYRVLSYLHAVNLIFNQSLFAGLSIRAARKSVRLKSPRGFGAENSPMIVPPLLKTIRLFGFRVLSYFHAVNLIFQSVSVCRVVDQSCQKICQAKIAQRVRCRKQSHNSTSFFENFTVVRVSGFRASILVCECAKDS